MHIEVNGTRLWFDVEGPALVPSGPEMRERPTVVPLHGGPGSYDHSYFKPDFARLARAAQVVYLDLRGHGRSTGGNPAGWSFEVCADDLRAFCDTLGIAGPVVYGHSMGGFVAMLYGARHPGHAGALVLQSTMARFDLERLVEGFRRFGGDEVAELAERDYRGHPVSDAEWAGSSLSSVPRFRKSGSLPEGSRTLRWRNTVWSSSARSTSSTSWPMSIVPLWSVWASRTDRGSGPLEAQRERVRGSVERSAPLG